jgi:hypothetical protein
MDMREYVVDRIDKYDLSTRMYSNLLDADVAAGREGMAKRRAARLEQLYAQRQELIYMLYFIDHGVVHPHLDSHWTPSTVGH